MASILDNFFDKNTISVHFKENSFIQRKKWKPGSWKLESLEEKPSENFLNNIINSLYEEVNKNPKAFLEIDRQYSKVMQLDNYRVVIVLPPVSDGIEITAVRPLKRLTFKDYKLNKDIVDLIENKAQWILIAGSPGEWKTTFAQALADFYLEKWKIVKTIESPRDLQLPEEVTQYSFSYAPHSEIRDILLLSRPDFSIYDEVRNPEDFQLFKDLRLTWIWLVWVTHATRPINVIQRLIWIIEMWIIPEVVDTIIFIAKWNIDTIFTLKHTIKVPAWMQSEDLARPVIEVIDFFSWSAKYEIYSYWDEVVTIPLEDIEKDQNKSKSALVKYAKMYIDEYLEDNYWFTIISDLKDEKNLTLYIPEDKKWQIIWKWWVNIAKIEKELWFSISVRTFSQLEEKKILPEIDYKKSSKRNLCLYFGNKLANSSIFFVKWNSVKKYLVDEKWLVCIKNKKDIKAFENGNWFWVSI